jgi:hypothetical protein
MRDTQSDLATGVYPQDVPNLGINGLRLCCDLVPTAALDGNGGDEAGPRVTWSF